MVGGGCDGRCECGGMWMVMYGVCGGLCYCMLGGYV